jgi:hypothetical protein
MGLTGVVVAVVEEAEEEAAEEGSEGAGRGECERPRESDSPWAPPVGERARGSRSGDGLRLGERGCGT